MRSEPQNIGLAFDVSTPKLSCLIRFDHLIFQANIVERVNSLKAFLILEQRNIYAWLYVPVHNHVRFFFAQERKSL